MTCGRNIQVNDGGGPPQSLPRNRDIFNVLFGGLNNAPVVKGADEGPKDVELGMEDAGSNDHTLLLSILYFTYSNTSVQYVCVYIYIIF